VFVLSKMKPLSRGYQADAVEDSRSDFKFEKIRLLIWRRGFKWSRFSIDVSLILSLNLMQVGSLKHATRWGMRLSPKWAISSY
jgi:hypothetical protein